VNPFLHDIAGYCCKNCLPCKTVAFLLLLVVFANGLSAAEENSENTENLLPGLVQEAAISPTVVGLDDYDDPFEPYNRAMFIFNDKALRYALIPLGNTYEFVFPGPVRHGVSRVFANLKEPINAINHTAQGRLTRAGTNLLRFITNSTLGIGGVFDPAQHWFDLAPDTTTFNATFAHFGIPSGPYLVMPLLGGTDLRNGFSIVTASTLHPIRLLAHEPDTTYFIVFDNFQAVIPSFDSYLELYSQAEDPYIYFRNQYLQGVYRDEVTAGE
jgi:phospholipid-binding lipoprotein MlaA